MSIKKFFNEGTKGSVTTNDIEKKIDIESFENVKAVIENNKELLPTVDYTDPKSFSKFGSAEFYYVNFVENVYKNYPYDGSKKEKQEWYNNLAYFEKYLFDYDYPKTTGYVTLGSSSWQASTSSITDGTHTYRLSSSPQYIFIKPSLNQSVSGRESPEKNIYDVTKKRVSSLLLDKTSGNTVEFWFKEETGSPDSYAIFDVWNSASITDSSYERLTLEVLSNNGFYLTYKRGNSGVSRAFVDVNFSSLKNSWHHYAFSFKSNENTDKIDIKVYVDANSDLSNSSNLLSVSTGSAISGTFGINNLNASVGSYLYSPLSSLTSSNWVGRGSIYGSIDEFKFWNIAKSHQEIERNWNFHVGGGVNTDDSNTDLNFYYKFNEGIINSLSADTRDSVILDYSGRFSNSLIKNYSLGVRSTGSAINSCGFFDFSEEKDPIIIEVNPTLSNYLTDKQNEGILHDSDNFSQLFNLLPNWIREQDLATNKDLKKIFQIVATYFDKLYLQIDQLNKIKHTEYQTDKQKSYPFAKELLDSKGLVSPDILIDSSILEEISSRDEERPYEEKFNNIKNLIYQNIYNNLTYIYKSKGTEKSFRNLFRAFGVDDEVIKLVLYSNNSEINLNKDKINYTSAKTNLIDFSFKNHHEATVYQYPSGSNSSVLYGATTTDLELIPQTFECIALIPNQKVKEAVYKWNLNDVSSSIFGVHSAQNTNTDLTWDSDDKFNFQVYAQKESKYSKGGRFVLKTNGFGLSTPVTLTSSYFNDLYDNSIWNLAVKVRPLIDDYSYLNIDAINPDNFVIEFFGIQSNSDTVQNEFSASYILNAASASLAMQKNKRVYVGAHRTNFTGSVLQGSDVKIITARYWYDNLHIDTIKKHARNFKAFGRDNPSKRSFLGLYEDVLQLDTLALNWDFDTVSGSNSNGQFTVEDRKTYSTNNILSNVTNEKHYGRGDFFPANSTDPVDVDYLSIAKNELPEQLSTSDTIDIRNEDDIFFTKDTRPIEYFLSLENSMYSIISEEMLNLFSSVTDYSNLIGNPLTAYKQDYKELAFIRQKFFEKVDNIPNFERYLNLFKWIDSSINEIIKQIAPASANISENISTVLESHILERNKYQRRLPIFNYREKTRVNFPIKGINELLNTPISGSDLWNRERLEKNSVTMTSGDSSADYNRQTIQNSLNNLNDQKTFKLKNADNTSYIAPIYVFRKLAKPYRFLADRPSQPSGTIGSFSNIDNIKSDKSDVYSGRRVPYNYRNNYEVVQTSGRTANNKYLNDISASLEIKKVESTNPTASVVYLDKESPNRTIQKTVFVEKFNAPGGPETNAVISLNEDSAEYSVYNSLNYRNLLARKNLNIWSGETASVTDPIPSYHKIPKNPKTGLNGETTYDNLFIQQCIPQSDKANSWIRSALAKAITVEPQIKIDSEKIFNLDGISENNAVYNYRIKFLSENRFLLLYQTAESILKLSLFEITNVGREKNISLLSTVTCPTPDFPYYNLEIVNYEKPTILVTHSTFTTSNVSVYTIFENELKLITVVGPNSKIYDTYVFDPHYWNGNNSELSLRLFNQLGNSGYIGSFQNAYEPIYDVKRLKDDLFVVGSFQTISNIYSDFTGSGYTLLLSKINNSQPNFVSASFSTSSFIKLPPYDSNINSDSYRGNGLGEGSTSITSFGGGPIFKIDILPLTDNSFIATYGQDSNSGSSLPTVTTGSIRTTYFTSVSFNSSSLNMTVGNTVTSSLLHNPKYDFIGVKDSFAYYSVIYTKRSGALNNPYLNPVLLSFGTADLFNRDKNVYLKFLKFNTTDISNFTSSNEITLGITDYIGKNKLFEPDYSGDPAVYEYGLNYKFNISNNTILSSKNDLQNITNDNFIINFTFLSASTEAAPNNVVDNLGTISAAGDTISDQNIFGYVTGNLSTMTLSEPVVKFDFLNTQSLNLNLFTVKSEEHSPSFITAYNDSNLTKIEYCSIADEKYFQLYVDEETYLNSPEILEERELYKNYSAFHSSYPNLSGEQYFIFKQQLFDPVVDFCGTNISVIKSYDENTNTISFEGASLRTFLTNLNGFYGFNTWNQIRNNQKNTQVKKARSNLYFIEGKNYKEPVLSFKKTLDIYTLSDTNRTQNFNNQKSTDSNKLKTSIPYLSAHEYFSNKNLQSKTNSNKSFANILKKTLYENTKNTYNDKDSITEFDYVSLTEHLYPKNTNISTTRTRDNYAEQQNTGSDGYERELGLVKTFWKDDPLERYKTQNNGFNNIGYKNNIINTDSNNNLKRGLFYNNSTSSAHVGYNIEKLFSIWPLDNFFLYNNSTYNFEEFGNLLSSSTIYNVAGNFYTDIETNTLNVIGDIAFPGHSEERKLTYLINPNQFRIKSTPRTQFIFNPYSLGVNYEPFGWEWKTNLISGKNPWYDSYEDYSNELRLIGKNYSVLPEYRVSDFVSLYLAGAIKFINKEFLKLDGVSVTSSIIKTTTETSIYELRASNTSEFNLANNNYNYLSTNFRRLSAFNSASAVGFNLKNNSSKRADYPFSVVTPFNQFINNSTNILRQQKYPRSTSLIFNNTGSETYLLSNITSISTSSVVSSSFGIYSPNLNTASFTVSTWFKLSENAYKNKSPLGLWHLTTNETNTTNSYNPVSFGVLLNTKDSLIGNNYVSGNVFADTDIIVYNNGPHDIGIGNKNIYTFYNNSSSILGNTDFPDTKILLDDQWHNLVVEYFAPESFSNTEFTRDQPEKKQEAIPFGTFYRNAQDKDEKYIAKSLLLKKNLVNISGNIKEENIFANIGVFTRGGGFLALGTASLGITIYKNIGDEFIELENIVKPFSKAFNAVEYNTISVGVDSLGTKDEKEYFIVNVGYTTENSNIYIDEYVICSYSSSLETGSFKTFNSFTASTTPFFTNSLGFSYKPIISNRFVNGSASSVAITSQMYEQVPGNPNYDIYSDLYYADIDYSSKQLTNKKLIKNFNYFAAPYYYNSSLYSISPALVDSNGRCNNKFIYSVSTSSANTEIRFIEIDNTGSLLKDQKLFNASTTGLWNITYVSSSVSSSDKHDNYILNNIEKLVPLTLINGTSSYYTGSVTGFFPTRITDVAGFDNKILTFGYNYSNILTDSSSIFFGTASFGIDPALSSFTASDLFLDLDVEKVNRINTFEFLKRNNPNVTFNFSSSSLACPAAYVDPKSKTKFLTNLKYNKNRGTNASIRVYLDGQPKYGKTYDKENEIPSLRPILINQPYKENVSNSQKEFNLNNLKVGYSDGMQFITKSLGFNGEIDEFSAWYGNLASGSVLKLYNSGSPSNLNELSYLFATQASTNPESIFESSSYMPTNITGNLFIWYRLGYADINTVTTTNNLTFNKNFYDLYGESDELSSYLENNKKKTHYSRIFNDHTTSVQNLTLTVNGISKLLPYNGFYPMQRTTQIAKSFKNSFAIFNQVNPINNTLTLGGLDIYNQKNLYIKNINEESVVQAALQPFMAPGMLFNSIKAGISVDWAAFTGSSATIRAANKPSFYDVASSNNTGTYVISSGSALRIPFEALANLQKLPKKPNSSQTEPIYYLNPTIYSFTSSFEITQSNNDSKFKLNNVYPYFIWNGTKASDEFELAINNFLAETPRFFLKNGALTTFKSKPSKEFKSPVSGNLYVMDVSLYKTKNFDMIISPKASSSYEVSSSSGRYFGPPINYKTSDNINSFPDLESIIADPAYAAYAPPYYYGKSTVRLKYYADKAKVTVDDIISNLQVEIINPELDELFENANGSTSSTSYQNRMTLDSSLELRGKELIPTSVKNGFVEIQASNDPINAADNTKWVISTKWECPTINFNDEESFNKPYNTGDLANGINNNLTWSLPTAGTGIWSGYSKNYDDKQGIFLKLEESFNGTLTGNTGSLIQLCGFEIAEKRIGTLAETKEISEAIVVIPYYEKSLYSEILNQNDNTIIRKQTQNEIDIIDEKHQFIFLNREQFLKAIKYVDQNKNSLNDSNIPNSMVDLIVKMEKYELPRHLDFLRNIKENRTTLNNPFAMYIFEFKRTLTKEDLGDIWQGVMPETAKIAKTDSIKITHPLTDTELLSSIENPENLKWLVFKVKRKAEKFYDSLTEFSDERFKPLNPNNVQNASFNWPYDYFSLVELANVDVKFDMYNDEFYDAERREVVIRPDQPLPALVTSKLEKSKVSSFVLKEVNKIPMPQIISNIKEKIDTTKNIKLAIDRLKSELPQKIKVFTAAKIINPIPNKVIAKPILKIDNLIKPQPALTEVLRNENKINTDILPKIDISQQIKLKTPVLDTLLNKQTSITALARPIIAPTSVNLQVTQSISPTVAPITLTQVTQSINQQKPEIKLAILNKTLTNKKR